MKPYIATLALGGLLLLCWLYLYAVEWPHAQRKAAEEQRAKHLIGFQSGDVHRMTLEYRGRDAIILDKGPGGQWRLMQPLQDRADHAEVEDVIRDVGVAEVTRVIHQPESDLSDYGLAPPRLTVSFMLADRTEQFFIGEKGPVSSQLYFKRISGPEIYLTNLPDRDILSKTPYTLRRKELVDIDRETIDRLRLESNTGTFSLFKTGRVWFLDAPVEWPADQSVIGSLLFQIENLKAEKFIDDVEEKTSTRARHGVPQLAIHLQANHIPHAIEFFASEDEPEWVYTMTTPDLPIFIIPRTALQSIPTALFDLRDKHLVVVDPSLVTDLSITTPDRQFTRPLESMEQPAPRPIQEFMNRVLGVQAEIPVRENGVVDDLHAFGLDAPALEVKLLGQGGAILGSLIVSEIVSPGDDGQAGSAYANGSTLPGVYGIRSGILVTIPASADLVAPIVTP